VKAAGDHWLVAEKKGRKIFSRGIWTSAATVERIRAELESMVILRVKGKRREVRRMLAQRSQELLGRYRRGEPIVDGCPLKKALVTLAGQTDQTEVSR
jgi:hypothetical protein